MGFNPNLVIRGAFIAALFLIVLTTAVTADATLPDPRIAKKNEETGFENTGNEPNHIESQEQLTACSVSQKFPASVTKWCALITYYGNMHELPVDLVAALIWQESGGKPQAYSRSGAVGLMQIMPRDGIAESFMCTNGPCFSNRPTIKELEDPEFNIQFGTKMLSRLVKKNGNLRDALKLYGPMDVGYSYADKVLSIYRQYGN